MVVNLVVWKAANSVEKLDWREHWLVEMWAGLAAKLAVLLGTELELVFA